MKRRLITLALAASMVLTMSCSVVSGLLGGGASGTVNDLWSDVPPFAGATKANLQLPVAAQLAINAVMQGKFNFIAYISKSAPGDFSAFYTKERMQAQGWGTDSPGCQGVSSNNATTGALCVFNKKVGTKSSVLVIFVSREDATKDTNIFYARAEDDRTPTPVK